MSIPTCEKRCSSSLPGNQPTGALSQGQHAVLELMVNNHPGVMSHVCGLFARRAFNVEGILCMPVGTGEQSRIWLLVSRDQRLDQMIKQIGKLNDVLDVREKGVDRGVFTHLEAFFHTGRLDSVA